MDDFSEENRVPNLETEETKNMAKTAMGFSKPLINPASKYDYVDSSENSNEQGTLPTYF